MSAPPQPPPFLGFRPEVLPGSQGLPYSQQQYPSPGGQPYPTPYPPQQFPGQHPAPAMPFPVQQFPKQQQYPPNPAYAPVTGGAPANYGDYGPPPQIDDPSRVIKDETMAGWSGFSDKAIRAVFVRKVYLILMVQLLFTLAVVSLFVFEKNVKLYVQRNLMWYYVSYFMFLCVYIALACCGNLRRKYPTNMIMLSIFTISMSYMLGTISSFYDTDVVLMAVGICAAVCLAVSVFSFHTKFDFTSCGGVLFILVWVLFLFGIISIFTYNRIMTTIYAGCGALLFTLFLAYDTQMLMGGKKHELSPEEHIFAAMQIYLDIVYIFMFLLTILGSGKSS